MVIASFVIKSEIDASSIAKTPWTTFKLRHFYFAFMIVNLDIEELLGSVFRSNFVYFFIDSTIQPFS